MVISLDSHLSITCEQIHSPEHNTQGLATPHLLEPLPHYILSYTFKASHTKMPKASTEGRYAFASHSVPSRWNPLFFFFVKELAMPCPVPLNNFVLLAYLVHYIWDFD